MDVRAFKVRTTITVPKIRRRCLPCELEAKTEPFIVVVSKLTALEGDKEPACCAVMLLFLQLGAHNVLDSSQKRRPPVFAIYI